MWWLNKDHRCRDRERKRTQSNDASRALQHMAHQSRVKPPHKLHALYIAICINKLLVFCSTSTNAWAKGTTPLTNKALLYYYYHYHYHHHYYYCSLLPHTLTQSFPQWDFVSDRCTKTHTSTCSVCLISFLCKYISYQVPRMRCIK